MSNPKRLENRAFYGRKAPQFPRILRHLAKFSRATWRHLRVTRPMTWILGPQYRPSTDRIEIDITYACNLRCINCNRSVATAPSNMSLTSQHIREFIEDSITQKRNWRSIRILGGEPTIHPEFRIIVTLLLEYRDRHVPDCSLEIVTNGHGTRVNEQLAWVPEGVWIENSSKTSSVNPGFRPFSMAPIDDVFYVVSDYSNGCEIMQTCGMGFGPTGYFQCAVAAGIDRVAKLGLGSPRLPSAGYSYLSQSCATCRLCGRFKDGHHVPADLRNQLTKEMVSPTWIKLYDDYKSK